MRARTAQPPAHQIIDSIRKLTEPKRPFAEQLLDTVHQFKVAGDAQLARREQTQPAVVTDDAKLRREPSRKPTAKGSKASMSVGVWT